MDIASLLPKPVKQAGKNALNNFVVDLCRGEWESQKFLRFNERPVEFAFVFRHLATLYPQSILDVGVGTTSLSHMMRTCGPLVTATDNVRDYWPAGMVNRHYWVVDDDIKGQWDLVTCVSVLEHIKQFDAAVRNLFRLTKPGGHVIITCPYHERTYAGNCYDLPGSAYGRGEPYVTQSYSRTELDKWCLDNGAEVIEQEFWRFWTGSLWTQGTQVIPPARTSAGEPHQLTCLLLRKISIDTKEQARVILENLHSRLGTPIDPTRDPRDQLEEIWSRAIR